MRKTQNMLLKGDRSKHYLEIVFFNVQKTQKKDWNKN